MTNPRAMVFQVDGVVHDRLVKLLEAYRRKQPQAQMSDLMRSIIGKAIEREKK